MQLLNQELVIKTLVVVTNSQLESVIHYYSVNHVPPFENPKVPSTHAAALATHSLTHRVPWLTLGTPARGERVREALAGTTEEGLCQ